jgi:hypothetical protein
MMESCVTLEETLQDFIVSTRQMFRETRVQFKETDRKILERSRQTEHKIDKLQGLFSSQWGQLIDAMVAPAALA